MSIRLRGALSSTPPPATLFVDTYNVLKSGVPNAIGAFKECCLPKGVGWPQSAFGDLTYLSSADD